MQNGEFSEVFIECYENPLFGVRLRQNGRIAWIHIPFCGAHDVMSRSAQRFCDERRHARVQQNFHVAAPVWIASGSNRSRPTTLRAYSKQACKSSRSNHG